MKYNEFYFILFRSTMKKVLSEHYGKEYARDTMKSARGLYKKLVTEADDIGDSNPMAYNALFALAFVAPYIVSRKKITPEVIQEMMRRSLYHVKFYFSMVDLNTPKGKLANQKNILKYVKWYTPERERQYPGSFKVDFEGKPYEGACYYRITRCPICAYCEKLGVGELMPLLCELDEVMIGLQHGVLHRQQTIASGGAYCDYFITGDREPEGPYDIRDKR
ncbi:MAG: L-2-amino-thiazoline-4-carboxylic acid hydrolase [Eubacteriales bacterium]|nr:L-2-amino-thiazoline-4-carboxylic acid hydrolase [Eubacteriales bacterium]